jgi:hypothetical protein
VPAVARSAEITHVAHRRSGQRGDGDKESGQFVHLAQLYQIAYQK